MADITIKDIASKFGFELEGGRISMCGNDLVSRSLGKLIGHNESDERGLVAGGEVFAAGNEVPAQALLELGKAVLGENALKRSRGLIGRRATSYKVKQFFSGGLCVHIGNILSY